MGECGDNGDDGWEARENGGDEVLHIDDGCICFGDEGWEERDDDCDEDVFDDEEEDDTEESINLARFRGLSRQHDDGIVSDSFVLSASAIALLLIRVVEEGRGHGGENLEDPDRERKRVDLRMLASKCLGFLPERRL
jgi:hypothetical protein